MRYAAGNVSMAHSPSFAICFCSIRIQSLQRQSELWYVYLFLQHTHTVPAKAERIVVCMTACPRIGDNAVQCRFIRIFTTLRTGAEFFRLLQLTEFNNSHSYFSSSALTLPRLKHVGFLRSLIAHAILILNGLAKSPLHSPSSSAYLSSQCYTPH